MITELIGAWTAAVQSAGLFVAGLADQDPQTPEDENVVAGWLGGAVLAALIVVFVVLCWSMLRHLRKVSAARDAGVYGDVPSAARTGSETAEDTEVRGSTPDGDHRSGSTGAEDPR